MQPQSLPIILEESHVIAPDVLHFRFSRGDKQPMQFIPGQFITLLLPHVEKMLRRSYSLASIGQLLNLEPQDGTLIVTTPYIEFAASYVPNGFASEFLFNLKPGDQVNAIGPYGRLTLREDEPVRYILIATGTGVTPYRAMLAELPARFARQPNLEVVVVLGVRTRAQLLYAEDFLAFAARYPQFRFHVFYSQESETDLKSHEHSGYVQTGLQLWQLSPERDLIYLCGNPNMIDAAFAHLQDVGFASARVRREKYISSGAG